jgi:hypothetical protein
MAGMGLGLGLWRNAQKEVAADLDSLAVLLLLLGGGSIFSSCGRSSRCATQDVEICVASLVAIRLSYILGTKPCWQQPFFWEFS